ncbi:GNAT family N-acetyltransferase [Fulvimarina pelagi]|nr:GNAT family protein [Fulvimarina pelagi]
MLQIETARFVQRHLKPSDTKAIETLRSWLADPIRMAPLNLPARELDHDVVARYVAGFDGRDRHLVGILGKDDSMLLGYRLLEINRLHARATLHVLIGDPVMRRTGVLAETMIGFYDWLFGEAGVNKIVGDIVAGNEPALDRALKSGFVVEAHLKQELRDQNTGRFLDVVRVALLKDDWMNSRQNTLAGY